MSVLDRVVDNNSGILDEEDEASVLNVMEHYADKVIENDGTFRMDSATGYLFLSGFKELSGKFRELYEDGYLANEDRPSIRIIMGPETSPGTKEFLTSLKNRSKDYLNQYEDEDLELLKELIEENYLEIRVYYRKRFHPKMYIFYVNDNPNYPYAVWGGSANFSSPGLTDNVELCIPFRDTSEKTEKYEIWFNELWKDSSTDFSLLKVIESVEEESDSEYTYLEPKYFFSKLLNVLDDKKYLFKGKGSLQQVSLLEHQYYSYQRVMEGLNRFGGFLLSNSVGTGKSYVASQVMQAYSSIKDEKCLLIHPSRVETEWTGSEDEEGYIQKFGIEDSVDTVSMGKLEKPPMSENPERGFELEDYKDEYSLIVIDEAHHYRNNNYRRSNLEDIILENSNADVLLVTATPVNLGPEDFFNLVDLFYKGRNETNFANAGIKELYDSTKEKIKQKEDLEIDSKTLNKLNELRKELDLRITWRIIQKEFEEDITKIAGADAEYKEPETEAIEYEYGEEYEKVLFSDAKDGDGNLVTNDEGEPISRIVYFLEQLNYEPAKMWEEEGYEENKNLLFWYKWQLYKRLESSPYSFLKSLENLRNRFEIYKQGLEQEDYIDRENIDLLPADLRPKFEELMSSSDDIERFKNIIDTYKDFDEDTRNNITDGMDEDKKRIDDLIDEVKNAAEIENIDDTPYQNDEKLDHLKKVLRDNIENGQKTVIFSEWVTTVEYLYESLQGEFEDIEYIHGSSDSNEEEVKELINNGDIDILITSDILKEGVNLPGADCIVNYDLPYNPVALVQRAGRVLRINNPKKIFIKNFKTSGKVDQELELFDTLQVRFDGILQTVGIDFIVWSLEEDKVESFKEREWNAHKETFEEYKDELANKNPEEFIDSEITEGDKFNLLLKKAIDSFSITLEDVDKTSSSTPKPFYTSLSGDYSLLPIYKVGNRFRTPDPEIDDIVPKRDHKITDKDKEVLQEKKEEARKSVRVQQLSSSTSSRKDSTLIRKLRDIRASFEEQDNKSTINRLISKIQQNSLSSDDKQKVNELIDEVDNSSSFLSLDEIIEDIGVWEEIEDISTELEVVDEPELLAFLKLDR
ncbi:MAG: helicase-related protein [Candidatus Nanohaloarchaea archaeon]